MLIKGHVFHGHDHGNHPLVPVATRHLVPRLHAALDGKENLNDLQHAGGEIVPRCQLRSLILKPRPELLLALSQVVFRILDELVKLIRRHADLEPFLLRQLIEVGFTDRGALSKARPVTAFLFTRREARRSKVAASMMRNSSSRSFEPCRAAPRWPSLEHPFPRRRG